MTHKDIYTKFMIEYDKANVTSSYPSLTEYEVATVLDKAYNALIAQKVTGNNIRRASFEADTKAISDLQPLIVKKEYDSSEITNELSNVTDDINNVLYIKIPNDFLYYVGCDIKKTKDVLESGGTHYSTGRYIGPIDQRNSGAPYRTRRMRVKLVSHQMADGFKASTSNIPWIKTPVCYIENDTVYIVVDPYDKPDVNFCELTYIKSPNKFAKDLRNNNILSNVVGELSYFTIPSTASAEAKSLYDFECNDTVAEELISLAVTFALENVESQRLNSKLNIRGLEA